MKKLLKIAAALITIFFLVTGCTSSNSSDIANILSPALLPNIKTTRTGHVSSRDILGNASVSIPAGEKITVINVPGPGIITRIWFQTGQQNPAILRQLLIRMYWDKEITPSVEVPFGDFFGCGFGYVEYTSQFLNMSGGGYSCYFPMPFEGNARIELVNETESEVSGIKFQVDYHMIETYLSRDIGYFHAMWRRDIRTDYDSNYTILNTRGRGHIVGLNLNIQSYNGKFDYLTGFESVYVDGEKRPSLIGTGTEDYFMAREGFAGGTFHNQNSGLILKDDSLGRIAAYRFHVSDAIVFKKSIKFSIEHGKGNQDLADYSSTVYWYQLEPNQVFPKILPAVQRIPLRSVTSGHLYEAENLNIELGQIKSKLENMSRFGPEWSGSKHLIIQASPASEFSFSLNKLEEVAYDIEVYYTRGPNFGNVVIYNGNEKIGQIYGYSSKVIPGGKVTLRNIPNPDYSLGIRFIVDGKDSLSSGYYVGLDGINLIPESFYIPEWKVTGPFKIAVNEKSKSKNHFIDYIFTPERSPEKGTEQEMKRHNWQSVKPGIDGFVSLEKFIRPNELIVNYAQTYIYSSQSKIMYLFVGSDDAVKVFFNDKQVYRYMGQRFAEPDQSQVYLRINQGWNKLMIKVANQSGSSGFYARILDREKILLYDPNQMNP